MGTISTLQPHTSYERLRGVENSADRVEDLPRQRVLGISLEQAFEDGNRFRSPLRGEVDLGERDVGVLEQRELGEEALEQAHRLVGIAARHQHEARLFAASP